MTKETERGIVARTQPDRAIALPGHIQEQILALYLKVDGLTRDKLPSVASGLGLTIPPDLDLGKYFVNCDGVPHVIMQPTALMCLVEDLQALAAEQSGSIVVDSFQAMQCSFPHSGQQDDDDDQVLDRREFSNAVTYMFNDSELAERAADTFFASGPMRADLNAFKRLLNEEQRTGVSVSSLLAQYAFHQCGATDDMTGCGPTLTLKQAKAAAFASRISYAAEKRLVHDLEPLVSPDTEDISFNAFRRLLEDDLSLITPANASVVPLGIVGLVSVVAPEVIISVLGQQLHQVLKLRALSAEIAERSQSFLLRNKLVPDKETSSADDGNEELSPEQLAEILESGTGTRRKKNPWLVIPRFMNERDDDEISAGIKQRVAGRKEQAAKRKHCVPSARQIGLMVQCVRGFPSVVSARLVYSTSAHPSDLPENSDPQQPSEPLTSRPIRKVLAPSRPTTGGRRRPPLPLAPPARNTSNPSLADVFCINQQSAPSPRGASRPLSGSAASLYSRKLPRAACPL